MSNDPVGPTWPPVPGRALAPPLAAPRMPTPAAREAPAPRPTPLPPAPMPAPEPTPPPLPPPATVVTGRRRGFEATLVLFGLVIGMLAFGSAGYSLGVNVDRPAPADVVKASSLAPFEASQDAINRDKVDGELIGIAGPWLPWVGGCVNSTDSGGPEPATGEERRTVCEYGGLDVVFVRYRSTADLDQARSERQGQNADAGTLAPGAAAPALADVNRGDRIEFAFRGADQAVRAGIWWSDPRTLTAGFLQGTWQGGLGEQWAPIRDLWERHR